MSYNLELEYLCDMWVWKVILHFSENIKYSVIPEVNVSRPCGCEHGVCLLKDGLETCQCYPGFEGLFFFQFLFKSK